MSNSMKHTAVDDIENETAGVAEQAPAWFSDPEGYCPLWCCSGHAQAFEEGCTVDEAALHISDDFAHYLPGILDHREQVERPGGGRWDVELVQRPRDAVSNPFGIPLVRLALRDADGHGIELDLTTGEARILVTQIVALTDKADLRTV